MFHQTNQQLEENSEIINKFPAFSGGYYLPTVAKGEQHTVDARIYQAASNSLQQNNMSSESFKSQPETRTNSLQAFCLPQRKSQESMAEGVQVPTLDILIPGHILQIHSQHVSNDGCKGLSKYPGYNSIFAPSKSFESMKHDWNQLVKCKPEKCPQSDEHLTSMVSIMSSHIRRQIQNSPCQQESLQRSETHQSGLVDKPLTDEKNKRALSIDTRSCDHDTNSTSSPDKICYQPEEYLSLPVPVERFSPNGLEINFYQTKQIMPESVSKELNFDQNWLVAIQPGMLFKEFVEVNQRGKSFTEQVALPGQGLMTELSNKSVQNRLQQISKMLHLKEISNDLHVPSSNQFLVFVIKKNFKLKIQRFYQCRCECTHKKSRAQKPDGHKTKLKYTNDDYSTIQQVLRKDESTDQQQYIDSLFTAESETSSPCLKVFTSIEKFYSHLRTHTQEKPFSCPIENCHMEFNQKGNLKQHMIRAHGQADDLIMKELSQDMSKLANHQHPQQNHNHQSPCSGLKRQKLCC